MKRLQTVLLLLALTVPLWAGESSWTSARGLFVVAYQSELQPIEINRMHAWVLHIADANGVPVEGAQIEIAGGMPQHDHGLATRPRLTAELGGGDYRIDGLRFHMTGEWQITLAIRASGVSDAVVITLLL